MATPTPSSSRQWICVAILALMWSTLALSHVVKPPPKLPRLRKLQMDKSSEAEPNKFWATVSDCKTIGHHNSDIDKTKIMAGGCVKQDSREDGSIHGEGHGSVSDCKTIGHHNSDIDKTKIMAGGCVKQDSREDGSIHGEGHGSGGISNGGFMPHVSNQESQRGRWLWWVR
uniref:uncharacterized protein LOC122596006 n=1 Tax=Erigeron canadensis TaxID=72917 RepID=UPI001CB8CD1F|nr:uncharacterized protein LOC122596006 [Erigeron canadensis]